MDPHHEEEAGDEDEEGEDEGGQEKRWRQGGGWGLLLQQEDCEAAQTEQELQEGLQWGIDWIYCTKYESNPKTFHIYIIYEFILSRLRALPTLLPRWQITSPLMPPLAHCWLTNCPHQCQTPLSAHINSI